MLSASVKVVSVKVGLIAIALASGTPTALADDGGCMDCLGGFPHENVWDTIDDCIVTIGELSDYIWDLL